MMEDHLNLPMILQSLPNGRIFPSCLRWWWWFPRSRSCCWGYDQGHRVLKPGYTPWKTKMTMVMETQVFEDVSTIKHGDVSFAMLQSFGWGCWTDFSVSLDAHLPIVGFMEYGRLRGVQCRYHILLVCSKDFEQKMKPTAASHNPNVDGNMLLDFVVSRGIIHIHWPNHLGFTGSGSSMFHKERCRGPIARYYK